MKWCACAATILAMTTLPRPDLGPTTALTQDHFGCLFADHVDRAQHEQSRDAWEDRGVYYTQSRRAVHLEIASQHSAFGWVSDRASARSMVAPRVIANVIPKIFVGLDVFAR